MGSMYSRLILKGIVDSLVPVDKALLLLGPRQTGKSTVLGQLRPELTVNLADESTYKIHLRDPALIKRQVQALRAPSSILVDEIQRLPELLNTFQVLIDAKLGHRYYFTGSSARKLRQKGINLLPGRLFTRSLYPLTYWELGKDFDLDRALTLGSMPEVVSQPYGADLLASYIDIYLREEVKAEALVKNIDSYARFLDLSAEQSGKIVNYSQIASDSEIPKETLRRYYEILVDTLLVHRLSPFPFKPRGRKVVQKDKYLYFDLGVRNGILGQHRNVFTDTQKGEAFEQWVILQLIAVSSYLDLRWKFYHYRDDKKNEVDLMVDTGDRILAIEIKYARRSQSKDLDSLRLFKQLEWKGKRFERILIFRGDVEELVDGIRVVPYESFLRELATPLA